MFRDGSVNVACTLEDISRDEIIKRLRQATLPPELVPLSLERRPFCNLPDEAIVSYVNFLKKNPEALGRLSCVFKREFGLLSPCPTDFTIKESHFDVNTLEPELLSALVSLGFEPDHFATLNPAEYEGCLTMKMEIPAGPSHAKRVQEVHDMMLRHSLEARNLSRRYGHVFGYLEMETFSSKMRHVFEFREIQEDGLSAFPFPPHAFEQIVVPSTEREATEKKMSLYAHKLIDIHVKVPSEARGAEFAGAHSPRMRRLGELFVEAGFYGIFSEGGNHIYTVQLIDAAAGKRIFLMLKDWATIHGGIVGIKMEICNYFYRTPRLIGGEICLAPIPNVVAWRECGK